MNEYQVSILIVDDDPESRLLNKQEVISFFKEITSSSLNIKTADSIESMYLELSQGEAFHVILLDRDLGEDLQGEMIDGIEHIPPILEIQPNARILVVTSFNNDPLLAMRALKLGATDFLTKGATPKEASYRKSQILNALKESRFEIEMLKRSIQSHVGIQYPCVSKAMKALDTKLQVYSQMNLPILITGEAGLGKTHAAKRLNELSKKFFCQKERIFSNINVNSLSSTLIESELFGHKKGTFTGAISDKQGIFSLAAKGDILLDEIGDTSIEFQGKLLKVLGEKVYRPIGAEKDLKTTARVILATNKDLKKLVAEGKFRDDLYDRISAFQIQMPQLAQRKEDIPFICQAITDELKKEHGKNISYKDFPKELKDHFVNGQYKGNIRGIENQIKQLLGFCPEIKSKNKLDYRRWRHIISEEPLFKAIDPDCLDTQALIQKLSERVGFADWLGLPEVKKCIQKLSVLQAHDMFTRNKLRADALGVSEAFMSVKSKEYLKGES